MQAEFGFRPEPDVEMIRDPAVSDAKASLGEEVFAAAWARGEGMTPEEILALALPK